MNNKCKTCSRFVVEFTCPYADFCYDGVTLKCKNYAEPMTTAKEHDLLEILKEKPLSPLHKTFIENSMDYEDYRKETIQWFKSEVVLYTFNEYSKLIEWLKGEK